MGDRHETDFKAVLSEAPANRHSIYPVMAMGQTVFVLAHHLGGDHSGVLFLNRVPMDEH